MDFCARIVSNGKETLYLIYIFRLQTFHTKPFMFPPSFLLFLIFLQTHFVISTWCFKIPIKVKVEYCTNFKTLGKFLCFFTYVIFSSRLPIILLKWSRFEAKKLHFKPSRFHVEIFCFYKMPFKRNSEKHFLWFKFLKWHHHYTSRSSGNTTTWNKA